MAREKNINYALFAETWNAADSAAEVAKQLGISLDAVYARLKTAKAHGHDCKVHDRRYLTDEEFCAIYRDAKDDAEVAERTGLARLSVRQKAYQMRERGHELPYRRQQGALPGQGQSDDDQSDEYDKAWADMSADPLDIDEQEYVDRRRFNRGQRGHKGGTGRPQKLRNLIIDGIVQNGQYRIIQIRPDIVLESVHQE